MQVDSARHAGRYVFQSNYTFQKAMGIISPVVDPFNLKSNYGPLVPFVPPFDIGLFG